MQVSHHGIAVPTGHEFYHVGMATTGEEGHSSASAEGTCADHRRINACGGLEDTSVPAEAGRDLARFDGDSNVPEVVVCCQDDPAVVRKVATAKFYTVGHELAAEAGDWATIRVATTCMGDNVAFDAIFLSGEN